MSKKSNVRLLLILFFAASVSVFAQTPNLIKRTMYKNETIEFGAGGTVTVAGAPNGSITIEGWQKNEVEISADIEMQALTEADLTALAKINGFVIDESLGHITIQSIGTYDKNYMKRTAKKFPKNLLGLPLKIDYRIKVPFYCDLEINGGKGDFNLSGVEGLMKINLLETNAKLTLVGGSIQATFGSGTVDVLFPNSSWRGRSADIQLINGTMNVSMPPGFNGYIEAQILRGGQIENSLEGLKPRNRVKFTDKLISAKAGSGGGGLSFTVGDGALKLIEKKD